MHSLTVLKDNLHSTTQNNTAKYHYYTELMNESLEDMTRIVAVKKWN